MPLTPYPSDHRFKNRVGMLDAPFIITGDSNAYNVRSGGSHTDDGGRVIARVIDNHNLCLLTAASATSICGLQYSSCLDLTRCTRYIAGARFGKLIVKQGDVITFLCLFHTRSWHEAEYNAGFR